MKSFLGLVGYYQRFIPGFATLASPLNDLTRKALPDRVTWSDAAERAFGDLRRALCHSVQNAVLFDRLPW